MTVSATELTVGEGGTEIYTVVLDSEPTASVTVTPSAAGSSDVTVSSALTFSTTNWSTAQTVTVSAAEDEDSEVDSAVVTHAVSGGDYGSVSVVDVSVLVSENESPPSPRISLSVSPAQVAEDAAATTITVSAVLAGDPAASPLALTVSVAGGTASASDFAAVAQIPMTIELDQNTAEATFRFAPTNDTVVEGDETVTVSGAGDGVTVVGTSLVIQDDDGGVLISPRSIELDEGTDATYFVGLSAEPTGTVTISTSVTGSPDVTVAPSTLSFTTTTWATTQTVTVSAAADEDEVEDTAEIAHSVAGGGYDTASAASVSVTVTEEDDTEEEETGSEEEETGAGTAPPVPTNPSTTVTLDVFPTSFPEGNGPVALTVTGTLDADPASSPTVVSLSLAAVTAVSADFLSMPNVDLVIPAGATSATATMMVTPIDDAIDEDAESVLVRGDANGLAVTAMAVMIEDDDTRGCEVYPKAVTVSEGATSTYGVVLLSAPTGIVTVEPNLFGSEDLSVSPPVLTFDHSNWDQLQVLTVSALHDDDAEVDAATVIHKISGADYGTVLVDEVALTVAEDEKLSSSVALALRPEVVGEGAGARDVEVTGTLDQAPRTTEITVMISVAADTAATTDFQPVPDFPLTIAPMETSGTATFRFEPVDDSLDEDREMLSVGGRAADLEVLEAPLTIRDDDQRGVVVRPTSLEVDEGDNNSYSIVLESAPTGTVTITPEVRDNDDVTVWPRSISFTESTWSQAQTIMVSAAHDADAEADQATVTHTVAGADYDEEQASDVAVTVVEDDSSSTMVTLELSPSVVSEGAGARTIKITGTLDRAALTEQAVVTVTVSADTASAADFAPVPPVALTIAPGEFAGVASFSLTPVNDAITEEDETLVVTGTSPDLTVAGTTLTIEDDNDELPNAWLSRFSRNVAEMVLEVVERRRQERDAGGLKATVAGFDVSGQAQTGQNRLAPRFGSGLSTGGMGGGPSFGLGSFGLPGSRGSGLPSSMTAGPFGQSAPGASGLGQQGMFGAGGFGGGQGGYGGYGNQNMLSGTSFSYGKKTSEESVFTLWGNGSYSYLRSGASDLNLSGNVTMVNIGADYSRGDWFGGVLLSHADGTGQFGGGGEGDRLRAAVTGLYPHLSYRLNGRVTIWSVLGHSAGDLTVTTTGQDAMTTEMETSMAAVGMRANLLANSGGLKLDVKSDALYVTASSEATSDLMEADADVDRLRLALEGSYRGTLGESSSLTPRLELGVRQDGGDAETGFGVDVGAGVTYQKGGLSFDVGGRQLVAHEADGFEDWGFAGNLTYDLRPESQRGLTLSLTPSLGTSATRGAEALWSRQAMHSEAASASAIAPSQDRLEATAEYGLPFLGGGTGAPTLGLSMTDQSREYRLGYRASLIHQNRVDFQLNIQASQRSSTYSEGGQVDHRVSADAVVRW